MSGESIDQIRSDIEETRGEMGETLHELGDRLDPSRIMNEATTNVRETAKGMSDMVMDTIKKNPIPTAMAVGGLAMLVMNRSHGSHNGRGEYYSPMYGTTSSSGERAGGGSQSGVAGQAQQAASSVTDRASGMADQARSRVDEAGQMARERMDQAGRTVGEMGQSVGSSVNQGMSQASNRFDEIMHSNPLAVGAVAIGAGALVGALIPETPQERQALGGASRQVSETIRERVEESTDEAERNLDKMAKQQQSSSSASG